QRDPSFDTLQRWLAVCKARLIIIDLTETPTGLTPEEERLISASRVLDPADMARATDVAEMFGRVDGIPAEIIRSQVDGFVRTLRNYIPKSVR
ncbi:MAG TPA: hypothetical protein PKY30_27060, partial [Myxococcota bacterium]|nr:hypothetical protein [Myxococcota bacterium]